MVIKISVELEEPTEFRAGIELISSIRIKDLIVPTLLIAQQNNIRLSNITLQFEDNLYVFLR
jgi:hypothetical protein